MTDINKLQGIGLKQAQRGFSLMEVIVSMGISLVATTAMVALMANSLGNAGRVINMTKLSDDLRSTMQLMTRDVRRASYNANAMFCYGNDDCGSPEDKAVCDTDPSINNCVTVPADITINNTNDCFTFLLDRNHDGDGTENDAGGFRRREEADGVGVIEMWTGNEAPNCAAPKGGNWVLMTNPNSMDITTFNVDDNLSYTQVIFDDGAGKTISQKVRKLRLTIGGELVAADGVTRRLEDIITVRNDLLM